MNMSNTYNPTGTQSHAKTIQPSDIKSLIQKQGKATIDEQELTLKSPALNDAKLQEIIKDPALSIKATSNPSANGEREFELSANGKSVKIKIDCKNCH